MNWLIKSKDPCIELSRPKRSYYPLPSLWEHLCWFLGFALLYLLGCSVSASHACGSHFRDIHDPQQDNQGLPPSQCARRLAQAQLHVWCVLCNSSSSIHLERESFIDQRWWSTRMHTLHSCPACGGHRYWMWSCCWRFCQQSHCATGCYWLQHTPACSHIRSQSRWTTWIPTYTPAVSAGLPRVRCTLAVIVHFGVGFGGRISGDHCGPAGDIGSHYPLCQAVQAI